ncbi:MAG: hybrid sensor histidine kinase/response regulator [Leptospira bouyouniensis]|uniref:Response regulator n=1 Tax=Leptospira bouyouniensis TaxID=2484911 RepID=A0A7I0HP04_9LEPT|nr:response regulator [Leptospira bouyouniensis]TGK47249.1 response regulator [Leptospira bouyouniensis]TGL03425.1 response regulator [Leptospira bouyouniensis]TGM80355.1 response regulator [Leptospira bouyouniensis]
MGTHSSLARVILLEDDPTISLLYDGILRKQGMEVTCFSDIEPAIQFLTENHLQNQNIVITDLQLPSGNGLDFVREIRKVNKHIPILVITSTEDPKQIIEVMKEHVQEYLIKPVIPSELLSRIQYQLSNKEDVYVYSDYEREKIISLEKLLEWYSYKNTRIKKGDLNTNELHKNLFYGLRTSLAQGAGFGVLTQLIDLIKAMPKAENGGVILDLEILNILDENAIYSKKVLDRFAEIEDVIFDRVEIEEVSPIQLFNEIIKLKEEIQPLLQLKDQILLIPEYKGSNQNSKMIKWNAKYFKNILLELLLNAMRFSKNSSKIYFLFNFNSDGIYLSTINSYAEEEFSEKGISNDYLELIFEPFFRITKNIYEKHGSLDFGIGLSFVKQTIEKFGGTITALNLVDHTNDSKETKIEFKIFLPYSSSLK